MGNAHRHRSPAGLHVSHETLNTNRLKILNFLMFLVKHPPLPPPCQAKKTHFLAFRPLWRTKKAHFLNVSREPQVAKHRGRRRTTNGGGGGMRSPNIGQIRMPPPDVSRETSPSTLPCQIKKTHFFSVLTPSGGRKKRIFLMFLAKHRAATPPARPKKAVFNVSRETLIK